ncbi:MAG: hypothetical protein QNK27_01810 [Desulfuromusa sp.]|nr:hypothetical protein [Desulfuromusa sp.]
MAFSRAGVGADIVIADKSATPPDVRTRILLKSWGFQVGEMTGRQFGGVMAVHTKQSINQMEQMFT